MTNYVKNILISTIGPPMMGDTDPIYQVAMIFPPKEILLISSDEPDHPTREPTSKNVENITAHFSKTKTPVKSQRYNIHEFDSNVIDLASTIIKYYKSDNQDIVLDLSAGRGSIRQALSRAAEMAITFIHNFHDPYFSITCTIRSKNQPVVVYEVGATGIPDERDAQTIMIVDQPMTQTTMAQKLKWNNQSEVSKSIQRLVKMKLIEVKGHKNRVLTEKGERIRELLKRVM